MSTGTQQILARVAGLSGALLLAAATAGLVSTQITASATTPVQPAARAQARQPQPAAVVAAETPAAQVPAALAPMAATPMEAKTGPHYPLQVGRYWLYRYHEVGSDVRAEIERVIVRRQLRDDGKELFIFDDGGVVYVEDGKVYEMSASGGVNIIPMGLAGDARPVVYRSQGMQIEKSIGAVDTTLVIEGRPFAACLEVVTRFRNIDGQPYVSYSTFYAPGIGMVGRQSWPRDDSGTLAVTLAEHGTRQL